MKEKLVIVGVLALILLMPFVGTFPAIPASAQGEDEDDDAERHDEESEHEGESSDSEDSEVSDEDHDEQGSSTHEKKARTTHSEHVSEHAESKTKIAVEDDGLEIELEFQGHDLDDGTYAIVLSCADPAVTLDLQDGLEVHSGQGELDIDVELDAGTYSDCELRIQETDMTLDIGSFTIVGEDDEQTHERQEERKREIVENHDAREIHDRHRSAQAASPGEYAPGAEYTLAATGLAQNSTATVDSKVNVTLGVWKSVRSLVLFDVLGGNVTMGYQEYTLHLGYAIYSENGDVLSMRALATDDSSGDIVRLSLRGQAENTEFPQESGHDIALTFEGNSGTFRNEIDGWELTMQGSVEAA